MQSNKVETSLTLCRSTLKTLRITDPLAAFLQLNERQAKILLVDFGN
jgi:hypothetical protein